LEALTALPPGVIKGAVGKALTAAAVPVVRALRATTPQRTGDLVEHLMTDIAIDSQGNGGVASVGYGKQGFKARMVEYGHRMVGHKPDMKESGVVRAHPWMRPAVASSGEASIEAFAESLAASVEAGIPGVKSA